MGIHSFRFCLAAAFVFACTLAPDTRASASGAGPAPTLTSPKLTPATPTPATLTPAPSYRPPLPKLRMPYRRPAHAPRPNDAGHPAFFDGETALSNSVYYLDFQNGSYFGYYAYLSDSHYIYHYDLGYEYVFDAQDADNGVYFYDFVSGDYFYTSPSFPFPYLYDFNLQSLLYYYPSPNDPGHYNTNGIRYFYEFATGQIITR